MSAFPPTAPATLREAAERMYGDYKIVLWRYRRALSNPDYTNQAHDLMYDCELLHLGILQFGFDIAHNEDGNPTGLVEMAQKDEDG